MTSLVSAHLRHLHDDQGLSWRRMHDQLYPTVPAGTLCSIAKGAPVPKKHRRALGVGRRQPDDVTQYKRAFTKLLKWIRS
jgi:hypothetical protein